MRTPKRGNPSEPDSLAAEVQRGSDESGKLPERIKRYSRAKARASQNITEIDKKIKLSQDKPIESPFDRHLRLTRPAIVACGDYLAFRDYYTAGKVRLHAANFCKVTHLCPLCAIRRGAKMLEAYLKKHQVILSKKPGLRASVVTFTVKNGDDLAERFTHLKKSISKLLEARRKTRDGKAGYHSQFAKIEAAIGHIEVTKDGALDGSASGWHPHVHFFVLHYNEFWDYVGLQAEWLQITGDSHVLNVTPAKHPEDPAQDFMEVFKYSVKFSDLTPEENLHAYEVMRGKQLIIPVGLFDGVKVPDDMNDPQLDNLPWVELLYQYLPEIGYSLAEYRDSEVYKTGTQDRKKTAKRYRPKLSKKSRIDNLEIPPEIFQDLDFVIINRKS